jgi:hypothetical protein
MATRYQMRTVLWKAWTNTIKKDYNALLLNSEGGLQTAFAANLRKLLPSKSRSVYVVPCVRGTSDTPGGKSWRRHPDIVVCDTKQVIAIVELKYLPRGCITLKGGEVKAGIRKDLQTFELCEAAAVRQAKESSGVQGPAGLQISMDRYRGKGMPRFNLTLAKDAVFCWAGVFTGEAPQLREGIDDSGVARRFLQLNALTSKGNVPVLSRSPSGRMVRAKVKAVPRNSTNRRNNSKIA